MNPNSPGRTSREDDIEWIGMEDIAEPSKPLNPPSTHASDLPSHILYDDDDEFDIDRDEGNRGLLSGTHGPPSYSARYLKPVGRIWPQVKSIVIEARVINAQCTTGPFILPRGHGAMSGTNFKKNQKSKNPYLVHYKLCHLKE